MEVESWENDGTIRVTCLQAMLQEGVWGRIEGPKTADGSVILSMNYPNLSNLSVTVLVDFLVA